MEVITTLLQQVSVDSPLGVAILIWIGKSINNLNHQVGIVIERVDSHEGRLARVEDHLINKGEK